MPPMQAHTAATATAIAVFMPTLPPAAAADTATQAMSKTDEHSPNRSPFFLIGMTEKSPAINAAIAAHTIETGA